jgi:hypothetical protein
MSNVRTLRAAFPGSDWKSSFVNALIRLRPDINPDAADEISDSEFATAQAMQPEIAAHHWAAANGPKPTDESRSA